jgi:hypothetical protein
MTKHVTYVDAETYDRLYKEIGLCLKPGPKERVCSEPIDHKGLHKGSDGRGTSLWGDDWKPNPNRTTWRSS